MILHISRLTSVKSSCLRVVPFPVVKQLPSIDIDFATVNNEKYSENLHLNNITGFKSTKLFGSTLIIV